VWAGESEELVEDGRRCAEGTRAFLRDWKRLAGCRRIIALLVSPIGHALVRVLFRRSSFQVPDVRVAFDVRVILVERDRGINLQVAHVSKEACFVFSFVHKD